MRQFWLSLALLGALSGCATSQNLAELRQLTPRGTPYAIQLTQHYLAMSEAEAKSYDWVDSSHFAEKGLRAGYGQAVMPEALENWEISPIMLPEVTTARQRLVGLLTEENLRAHPKLAADTVFAFDRWLEELEEGWDGMLIAKHQDAFYHALEAYEFALSEAEMAAEEIASPSAAATDQQAYLVYFGLNQSIFNEASQQVVQQVIAQAKQHMPEEIVIHGHTDRSGSASYNLGLSQARALAVLEALIRGGIAESILRYFAFGESDPAVETPDGVKEPRNRRVEIFIG